MKLPKDKVKEIEIPELMETFVDSLGKSSFDGQTLRMDLCVTRLDEPKPPKPPSGKKYPACRLVLSPDAAVDLYNALQQFINIMVQHGLVKREDAPKGTVQ